MIHKHFPEIRRLAQWLRDWHEDRYEIRMRILCGEV
jgi:hypothetical protein